MGNRQLWNHIGNAMEIVKIGKKLGKLLLFAKFAKVFFAKAFYYTVQVH